MSEKRQTLLFATRAFCEAFADKKPPVEMFSYFSTSDEAMAYEHGLPELAPFLGREFRARTA